MSRKSGYLIHRNPKRPDKKFNPATRAGLEKLKRSALLVVQLRRQTTCELNAKQDSSFRNKILHVSISWPEKGCFLSGSLCIFQPKGQ